MVESQSPGLCAGRGGFSLPSLFHDQAEALFPPVLSVTNASPKPDRVPSLTPSPRPCSGLQGAGAPQQASERNTCRSGLHR